MTSGKSRNAILDVRDTPLDVRENTLGGRISLARENAGISAEDAALRLGVIGQTWRSWESDRAEPRANRLMTMAGILGVAPLWLMTGTGDAPDEQPAGEVVALRRELNQVGQDLAALTRRIADVSTRLEGTLPDSGAAA